jgi:hypothetical protein
MQAFHFFQVKPDEIYGEDKGRPTFYSVLNGPEMASVYYLGAETKTSEQWFIRFCNLSDLHRLRSGEIDYYSFFKNSPSPLLECIFSGDRKSPSVESKLLHPHHIDDDCIPLPGGCMDEDDFVLRCVELDIRPFKALLDNSKTEKFIMSQSSEDLIDRYDYSQAEIQSENSEAA